MFAPLDAIPREVQLSAVALATYSMSAFAFAGRGAPSVWGAVLLRPLVHGALLALWSWGLGSQNPGATAVIVGAVLLHATAAALVRRLVSPTAFVAVHSATAGSLWLLCAGGDMLVRPAAGLVGVQWLLGAYCAVVPAGAEFVGRLVRPYLTELARLGEGADARLLSPRRGLANAGRTIGQLERLLVLVLLVAGQPTAIGFLVAAKSIFRFGELRDTTNRMESEYIIIGTLASFAYALVVGLAAVAVLGGSLGGVD